MAKPAQKFVTWVGVKEDEANTLEDLRDVLGNLSELFPVKKNDRGSALRSLDNLIDRIGPWWHGQSRPRQEQCVVCKNGWDEMNEFGDELSVLVRLILEEMPRAAQEDIEERKDLELSHGSNYNSQVVWKAIVATTDNLRNLVKERSA